jgi:hypothetical protein
VTFEAIEEQGVEVFLQQIRDELIERRYLPLRARKKEIPKDGGRKVRVLSIPSIRDRVVQVALKLIVEPIFEAFNLDQDFERFQERGSLRPAAHRDVYQANEFFTRRSITSQRGHSLDDRHDVRG